MGMLAQQGVEQNTLTTDPVIKEQTQWCVWVEAIPELKQWRSQVNLIRR